MDEVPPVANVFADNPPTVEPKTVIIRTPCRGQEYERFCIVICNPNSERCMFKVMGSKLDRFSIDPVFGFVEGNSRKNIICRPNAGADGFNRYDHFSVCIAPAPSPGDLLGVKDVWKGAEEQEPKQTKRYRLPIHAIAYSQ